VEANQIPGGQYFRFYSLFWTARQRGWGEWVLILVGFSYKHFKQFFFNCQLPVDQCLSTRSSSQTNGWYNHKKRQVYWPGSEALFHSKEQPTANVFTPTTFSQVEGKCSMRIRCMIIFITNHIHKTYRLWSHFVNRTEFCGRHRWKDIDPIENPVIKHHTPRKIGREVSCPVFYGTLPPRTELEETKLRNI